MKRILAAFAGLVLIAACGSSPSAAHHAAAHHHLPSARELTLKGCRMLAHWENTSTSSSPIGQDPVGFQISQLATGIKFGKDFDIWANGPVGTGNLPAADQVAIDCRNVGVAVFGG